MGARRKARELALQMLFQHDMSGNQPEQSRFTTAGWTEQREMLTLLNLQGKLPKDLQRSITLGDLSQLDCRCDRSTPCCGDGPGAPAPGPSWCRSFAG